MTKRLRLAILAGALLLSGLYIAPQAEAHNRRGWDNDNNGWRKECRQQSNRGWFRGNGNHNGWRNNHQANYQQPGRYVVYNPGNYRYANNNGRYYVRDNRRW